jgi:alpha,alpha-trehalose phosphorylase
MYVRGQRVVVTAGTPCRVALDDHGPRIDHVPRLQTGDRRPDGTLITASVPEATPVRG